MVDGPGTKLWFLKAADAAAAQLHSRLAAAGVDLTGARRLPAGAMHASDQSLLPLGCRRAACAAQGPFAINSTPGSGFWQLTAVAWPCFL